MQPVMYAEMQLGILPNAFFIELIADLNHDVD